MLGGLRGLGFEGVVCVLLAHPCMSASHSIWLWEKWVASTGNATHWRIEQQLVHRLPDDPRVSAEIRNFLTFAGIFGVFYKKEVGPVGGGLSPTTARCALCSWSRPCPPRASGRRATRGKKTSASYSSRSLLRSGGESPGHNRRDGNGGPPRRWVRSPKFPQRTRPNQRSGSGTKRWPQKARKFRTSVPAA